MPSPVLLLRPLTLNCALRRYVFISSNYIPSVMYFRASFIHRAFEVEYGQFTTETRWKFIHCYKPSKPSQTTVQRNGREFPNWMSCDATVR
jgi:hypothetical protein